MRKYWKIYLVTVIIAAVSILLPWGLQNLGITNSIDILEWQGILLCLVALVFTVLLVFRKVKEWKARIVILLLNPALYYIIVVACIGIMLASGEWHGFAMLAL